MSTKLKISELISTMQPSQPNLSPIQVIHTPSEHQPYLKVPACDTEVFYGGYEDWPSFRDMFTAVYINHPKLSQAQKPEKKQL